MSIKFRFIFPDVSRNREKIDSSECIYNFTDTSIYLVLKKTDKKSAGQVFFKLTA